MYNTISYAQTKERFNALSTSNDRDKIQRRGNKSPTSIMHSQAMIEKSKQERLKSGGSRMGLMNDTNIDMSFKASTQQNSPRGTNTVNSSQVIFEEMMMRDEVLT